MSLREREFFAREQGRIDVVTLLNEPLFTYFCGDYVRIDGQRTADALELLAVEFQEARYWRVLDAWRRSCREKRLDIERIEREVRLAHDDRIVR
jgi:hypothetical protein